MQEDIHRIRNCNNPRDWVQKSRRRLERVDNSEGTMRALSVRSHSIGWGHSQANRKTENGELCWALPGLTSDAAKNTLTAPDAAREAR